MIADINQKTEIANKQEAECTETKASLEVQNIEITKKKKEADDELQAAEPIMEEAQQALNDIKQADLSELKAVATPAPAVFKVC